MTTAITSTGQVPSPPSGGDPRRHVLTRRRPLAGVAGAVGLTGAGGVAAWAAGMFDPPAGLVSPGDDVVGRTEAGRARPGAATVTTTLHPRPVTLDLAGVPAPTWATPSRCLVR